MIFFFWISKIIDVDKSHRLHPNSARNCCRSVNRALRSAAEEVAIFVPVFVLYTPSWLLGPECWGFGSVNEAGRFGVP